MTKTRPPPKYADLKRKLRHLSAEQLFQVAFKKPPNGEEIRVRCNGCASLYQPAWNERLTFEFAPFESSDGSKFVPVSAPSQCPKCGRNNHLFFPEPVGEGGDVTLFGDEAYDITLEGPRAGALFVYALFGTSDVGKAAIKEALDSAKRQIRPNVDPDKWALHTLDVRSPQFRAKMEISLSIDEINKTLSELASSLSENPRYRFISATLYPASKAVFAMGRKSVERLLLERTLTGALIETTHYLTKQGHAVSYILEAQSDDHTRGWIDSDVEKIGRSLRHSLAFHHACHRQLVRLPITEPKEAHWELQIADLIAFMVRRHFHQVRLQRPTEIPVELLGEVHWASFVRNGFKSVNSIGFQPENFFPEAINPWRNLIRR